ncbi:hypothetical protein [Halobaculum sp. P14]|uniref:hypothetical protein n=1 Tax=Halobaculum sp. P14 TaxID=3421638 RepID=UPI003EBCE5F6
MNVETTDDGLRAVDAAKNALTVETDGWEAAGGAPSVLDAVDAVDVAGSRQPDTVVSGETRQLRFPPVFATVTDVDTGETFSLDGDEGPVSLPPGNYLLKVDSRVVAYVRFSGAVTLSCPGYERLQLDFPTATTASVGFVTTVLESTDRIRVPESPAGVAAALSAFSAGGRTTTPDRSFATMRGHPPHVEFDDDVAADGAIPASIRERTDDADVELTVPPELRYLFPLAPLAYYTGAAVRVDPDATPTLTIPGREEELDALPAFQRTVGSLLERVFYLDCLVRTAGPHGSSLSRRPVLDELGLDADDLYREPMARRLDAYLSVPFDDVRDRFPEWHLAMAVEPTYEHVRTLPHLVANVPHVTLPEATRLDEDEWLDRSLGDFYRGAAGDVASVELVRPTVGPGRTQGWLADGVPIDAFKTVPEAYENRADYLDDADEPTSIVAILNDSGMAEEHAQVAAHYRQRAEELTLDITVEEHLTADELADVFESRHDLVHYIGHCEADGLRCADGYLSVSSIDESNAQTFFLNACGSYHEGIELIRKGSVAGGVTFNSVLDSHAATVGTMFARLMVNGYSIERALDKSRRRIMTGKDYAVVGDGTHVLTQSVDLIGTDVEIRETGDGTYGVDVFAGTPESTGGYFRPYLQEGEATHLFGTDCHFEVSRRELETFLSYADSAVLYEGELQWSDAVLDRLG